MGIVTPDEFESQLTNVSSKPKDKSVPSPTIEGEVIELPSKGRKEGDNNVPEGLRNLIGLAGATEGRQEALALAKMFGVSESSASAYTNGATSTKTYNEPNKKITDVIRSRKDRLTKKALLTLGNSLDKITEDKLDGLGARDLAAVSKDMAAVVKSMEPDSSKSNGNVSGVQFVVFTPEMRVESSYDSVTVNE